MTAILDAPVAVTTARPATPCECSSASKHPNGPCDREPRFLLALAHTGERNQTGCETATLHVCPQCKDDYLALAAAMLPALCEGCRTLVNTVSQLVTAVIATD